MKTILFAIVGGVAGLFYGQVILHLFSYIIDSLAVMFG